MIKLDRLPVFYVVLLAVETALYAGFAWLWGAFVWWQVGLFALGLVVGMALLLGDELLFHQWYAPEAGADPQPTVPEPVATTPAAEPLLTRSTLFLIILIPLSLFIVTSSGSLLGTGLILGLTSGLVWEMWRLRLAPEQFHQSFLSQLKRSLQPFEIQRLVWGAIAFVVILHLLVFTL